MTTMQQQLNLEAPVLRNIPSISGAAMLVSLSISQWNNNRLDKQASVDVTTAAAARKGAARVHKTLLPDCAEYAAVQSSINALRTYVVSATLPWADRGPRLLTTANYLQFHGTTQTMIGEIRQQVDHFVDHVYPQEVHKAAVGLGTLFNPSEYPSPETVRSAYDIRLAYLPVPEVGDWRVDMGNEASAYLQEQYADHYRRALGDAMTSMLVEAHEGLARLVDRLGTEPDGKKRVFRDSMLENITQITHKLQTYNLTGDPEVERLRKELVRMCAGLTPDELRNNDTQRVATRKDAEALLASMPTRVAV